MENIKNIPLELLFKIYENLSDPVDIFRLSRSSIYEREVLKKSIKKLNTKDELLYLDIGWLTQYHRLEDVSDEIIFNIDASNLIDLSIPRKLKRFNIRIFIDNTLDIHDPRISYNIIKDIFEKIIEVGNIYEYTVRIIINYEAAPLYDTAIIIDLGNFAHLINFNNSQKLTYITPVIPNYTHLFESLDIKLIVNSTNIPIDTMYFNHIIFNNKLKLRLDFIFYPNRNFSNFFDEVFPIIVDADDNIQYTEYWETVKINYKSTGFMSFKIIKSIIKTYSTIKKLNVILDINNGMKIVDHDILLDKYLGIVDMYSLFIRSSFNYLKDKFKYPDNNISPAHYYITDPLIQEMYD